MKSCTIDGSSLTIPAVSEVVYEGRSLRLSPKARKRMQSSRALVEEWIASDEPIYGVTTGFGEFSNVHIGPDAIEELQQNLIFSHAAGAGEPLPPEVVRAMMLLRINALAKGYSGVRLEIVHVLTEMLNHDIVPWIPSQGSVGASGDLVQLAHLVLAMMGKGNVWSPARPQKSDWIVGPLPQKNLITASRALKRAGLTPVRLRAKEGLALINGTQMMTAYAALAVHQAHDLCRVADVAAAITLEALRGSDTQFDERIHRLRPYQGQLTVARNMRRLMAESEIRESHRFNDTRVQDAYSLRCIPQVHGATRDTVTHVSSLVDTEINSATDNPLIFPEDRVHLEGGNFHGQPIALAMDFLAIALSELASISERRIERLVNGSLSGLPRFLTSNGGLHSGMMITQYTAASIVSENKVLSHPGSVDSIPTSANQEDHNSMGSVSAQKAWKVLKNAQTVVAIELMCACQGLEFARTINSSKPLKAGRGVEAAYRVIRQSISRLREDRILHGDIQTALKMLVEGRPVRAVEQKIGPLD